MKLKVLHLTYDMRIGGTEMVIKNIIEGSDSAAYEMSIFCIETPLGPWGEQLAAGGIKVTAHERQPGFDVALIKAIRAHLKQEQMDVIHCHQYTPWVYGSLAAIGLQTRVIFTEHGRFYPDSSSWKRKLVNPWLCRVTDAITAISEATRIALAQFENLPVQRIETIYNGIQPLMVESEEIESLRHQLGLQSDTVVLGTVARMDPIKNHPMMLEAFAKVVRQFPNTVLFLVGDGEERKRLDEKIASLSLEGKVFLPGYQSDPRVYIALMDVFLLSSLSEGTSMTLLEGMSLSKPCVVTDVGGNPEIIRDGYNGLVTKMDDADDFAEKIMGLLAQPNLRKKFASNALVRYRADFEVDRMVQRYAQLYLGAIKG